MALHDPIQPLVSAAAAVAQTANITIDSAAFAAFRRAYDSSQAPEHAFQLMASVHNFTIAACRKYGVSEQAARTFFDKLQAEVFQLKDMTLKSLAIRLWDSSVCVQLAPDKIEFSSLVNRMLRERDPELLPIGCSVVRGINLLFDKNDDPNVHLPSSKLHRGGTLPLQHLPFFTAGKRFRAPMFLSFSFDEGTAHG
jgi:hypothetical protein